MRWRDFDDLPPLPDDFFNATRRVHFIGIGGIGMSALALALLARGHQVSGSDAYESALLDKLRAAGAAVTIGHHAENLHLLEGAAEAVIWGSAITPDNPERAAAQQFNIPQWHRAQLLAYFVNGAKYSIAVSGTHGKSTTSAMIAHILTRCGQNPTALLGAQYPPFGSNARIGNPDLVVVEADESDGSFTLLKPSVAVVTNVEPEHLENYDDSEDELWRAFKQFITQAEVTIINSDDKDVVAHFWENGTLFFGLSCDNHCDLRAADVQVSDGTTQFDLIDPSDGHDERLGTCSLPLPGQHNVSNALAAICASTGKIEVPGTVGPLMSQQLLTAAQALADFHGIARRFERKGEANGVLVYDDYGHHPTEVRASLEAAREFLHRPIVVIFQPHRYSRTQQMGHLFGPSFEAADRVIITELYSAFEEPIEGVSGQIVFDSVRAVFPAKLAYFAATLQEARRLAGEIVRPGDALLTMGAGDISTLGPLLLQDLQETEQARQDETQEPG